MEACRMIFEETLKHNGIEGIHGRKICRTAVRAVILVNNTILMIHSKNKGDYKFPGGGVNQDEKPADALVREIKEESGFIVKNVGELIGRITEYDRPLQAEYDVFEMMSYYYYVEVTKEQTAQTLDKYEKDLGFVPVWIGLIEAIASNEKALSAGDHSRWVARETLALRYLQQNRSDVGMTVLK
jgi:ADP-ribose pyrophosphatase YjhB (NUDIX family)